MTILGKVQSTVDSDDSNLDDELNFSIVTPRPSPKHTVSKREVKIDQNVEVEKACLACKIHQLSHYIEYTPRPYLYINVSQKEKENPTAYISDILTKCRIKYGELYDTESPKPQTIVVLN